MPRTDCPFCAKIAALDQLRADELVCILPHSAVLLGPWQYYLGYCIVIARAHATELSQLTCEDRAAYLEEMCTVARAIQEEFGPHKLNYELLGNQVPHLHWHVFPRYPTDPELLKPVWLALDRAESDEAERRRLRNGRLPAPEIAARLRTRLGRPG